MKLFLLLTLLTACGSEKETEYVPVAAPPPSIPAPNPPARNDFTAIQAILNESCGGSCHGGASFLQSEQGLRNKKQVRDRILNESMPPSYAPNFYLWQDGTRKKAVLDFLNEK